MALSDGLRLGGVYLDVRIDRQKAMDDMRALRSDLERFARQNAIGMGGSGGGSTYSATLVGAGGGSSGGLGAAIRSQTTTLAGLLQQANRSLATIAQAQSNQDRAARSAFRAERAEFRRAGLRQAGEFFGGRFSRVRGAGDAVNSLPADVRYLGGIGFADPGQSPYSTSGQRAAPAVAREAARAAREVADATAAVARTVSDPLAAMTRMSRPAPVAPAIAPWPTPMKPAGFDDPERTEFVHSDRQGAYYRRGRGRGQVFNFGARRSGRFGLMEAAGDRLVDFMAPPLMRARDALSRPGPLFPGLSGLDARLGSAALSGGGALLGGGARLGGRMGMGAIGALGGGFDAAMLGVNRFQSGMEAIRRGLDRMRVTLGPLRAGLSGVFSTALMPLRLFSREIDQSVRQVGALRTVSAGMGSAVAAPFRLALSPVGMLLGGLRQIGTHLQLIGTLAVGAFVSKGVMAASAMNEEINVTEAAFGDFANSVRSDASDVANRFGLIEEAFLETSNTFGLLLTGMGVGQRRASELSTELAQLSADMSSFFDVSQAEAADALASGLRGRFRPLSRFGAVISAEDVSNLMEARGEAGRMAEAMARVELITRGLSPAMGDLTRTMNSPANLMRELQGRVANLAGELGARLLPAWRELLLGLNDMLSSSTMVGRMVSGAFDAIGSAAQKAIHLVRQAFADPEKAMAVISASLRLARENIGAVFRWLADTAAEVGRLVAGTLGDLFMAAFEGLRDGLKLVWESMGDDLVNAMADAARESFGLLQRIGNRSETEESIQGLMAIRGLTRDEAEARIFAGRDNDRANAMEGIRDGIAARMDSILERFANFDLPEFQGVNGEALQEFKDSLAELQAVLTRGDGGDGDPQRAPGRLLPEGMDDEADGGGRRTTRSGSMVSAEQLRDLQNQGTAERKQIGLLEQIARGITSIDRLTQAERAELNGQLSTAVAVAGI